MAGGRGFNGSILSSPGVPIPLGRGYATFASDSGHQGASTDESFALNDEAIVTRDRTFDWRGVDPKHPGKWRARLAELASLLDRDRTDLSAFARRGGKVILLHGMADEIIPVQGTERYYEGVVRAMGRGAVAGFLRFYELPGTEHSGVGTAFTPTWDVLGALDRWVTAGQPPETPEVTDVYAVKGRSRPLCAYPGWPRYRGSGDVNAAGSFECAE